jgi:neutral ceramidase
VNIEWQHKSRNLWVSTGSCVLAFFLLLVGGNAQGQILSAGAARVEITPATNMLNWVGHQPYAGVLDPIFVRALVLSDGANRVAILAWDLVDTREGIVAKICAAIAKSSGIPATNILINASHTHSAPWAPAVDDPLLAHERKTLLPVEQGPACREWSEHLPERCVAAVCSAEAARRPATMAIGRAYVGEVLFNRRPVREDGKVETTFEPADPFALRKGQRFGPVDPTLTVLVLHDERDKTIATIFNLPCHSVCIYPYYQGISADWPGSVCSELQDALGGEALFLQGCAGDIVPTRRGLAAREQMARFISNRALTAITNCHPLMPAQFRIANVSLELPLTEAAQRDIKAPIIKTEVQVIACGTLAIVGLPGEPLIGLAQEIQRRSPFPHTVVLGYSNGGGVQYVGMPGDKAKGGYEMTEAGAGADNCGQVLIDAARQALNELAATPVKNLPPRALEQKQKDVR